MKQFVLLILIASVIVFGIVYSFSIRKTEKDGVVKTELIFGDGLLERAVSQKEPPAINKSAPPPMDTGRPVVPSVTHDSNP